MSRERFEPICRCQVPWPGGTCDLLCISDREPPGEGPRRVSHDGFRDGREVEVIREAGFETVSGPGKPQLSPGGPRAWPATIVRRSAGGEGSR